MMENTTKKMKVGSDFLKNFSSNDKALNTLQRYFIFQFFSTQKSENKGVLM